MCIIAYLAFIIFIVITICNGTPYQLPNSCGYNSCNLGKADRLNVHLVAHTHDDVGWLKTVDQYFYGARKDIRPEGVQYIIDSAIESLLENPDRRFIYVEIAFFWRWWIQQTEDTQNTVRQLVNQGRLEFISGGWSMHDEGATHYNGIIDQHSLGAEFLRDQFDECGRPKIGWQIDPFGHSREVASLFAQDDPRLQEYNVPERVQAFIQAAHNQARNYATNHIIMTMGQDFTYQNANEWFKNLDKLIKYVNEQQANGSDVNVFYSTSSCYLYALNKADRTWSSKIDDFFPYAIAPHLVRTGFYTSRSTLKRYERYSNNILQVTRQLNAFSNVNMRNSIFPLNEAMGIVQHHDAISGTEKQHVADDYVQRLSQGIDAALIVMNNAYAKLLPKENQSLPITPHYLCQLSNISECLPIEKQDRFTLTLWNPTVQSITSFVRVPVTNDYTIIDPIGQILPSEFVRVDFDNQGNLLQITNYQSNISVSFSNQGLYWYHSYPNGSGAYVFRPLTSNAQPISNIRNITCTKSKSVQSALIIFNEWGSEEVSIFDGSSTVEFEWTVGPIPIDDYIGKEVIIRYDTDLGSTSKYYTDANGREVLERIRNYRPTWNYTVFENVSGNYYPINSRIWIKDQQRQFTVLTDRSHGGGSISDGSIEIMIHRRIPNSDPSSAMMEPLNETAFGKGLVVRGKHLVIIDTPNNSALIHRANAQQFYMQPISTFALTNISYANYSTNYRQTWSALPDTMPLNLHLLTLDQLSSKEYLVRVEHYFELHEDEIYSQPIQIDLQKLLNSLGKIIDVIELTLAGNMPLSDMKRLNWTTTENESSHWKGIEQISSKDTIITLNPMQIRTFQITMQ
ncbi:unnamed protein product [Rotaria sordida]|uniref:Glycoside hydrolase family 38 central domain-containing protein n=2 Tax=Rotaria sordida TaxID=392033 RepID=A0A819SC18_9BILA|nr:unnamed protein product [Rotaria sordida]